MIRLFILIVVVVAIVSSVLHVSAGWAWIIVLIGGGVFIAYVSRNARAKFVTPSAMWKCPYCLKRTKLGATACHHCGRGLLVTTKKASAAAQRSTSVFVEKPRAATSTDVAARLATLKGLHEQELISPAEYEQRRAALLAEL